MDSKRNYRHRGTPDLPMATYIAISGKNMNNYLGSEYHPETEFSLQAEGTCHMRIDDRPYLCRKGDIIIVPPNIVHQRIYASEDARIHSIVFSTDAIRMLPGHFFQKGFVQPLSDGLLELPRLLQPCHPAYEAVYGYMMQLEACRIYEKNYKQHRLLALMGICLALMPYCRVITQEAPIPDPGHEGVKLCMRYLHNNHTQKITLPALAKHCHLHPNYLCAVFKQYTGETIFDYLTRIRVESAQRLLKEDLPVNKVAELSGFRSECLLYRKFKELTGMTPKAYAKKEKGKIML